MPNKFQPGQVVRHFKRDLLPEAARATTKYLYRIHGVARHSETDEPLMIYEALYGAGGLFARPLAMFESPVDAAKYPDVAQITRFAPATTEEQVLANDWTARQEQALANGQETLQQHPAPQPANHPRTADHLQAAPQPARQAATPIPSPAGRPLTVLIAVDRNNALGANGDLLYHIPGDLRMFRLLTTGNIMVMGRRTLEAMPGGRPLPNRWNVVLTRGEIPAGTAVQTAGQIDGQTASQTTAQTADAANLRVAHNEAELAAVLDEIDPHREKRAFLIGGANVIRSLYDWVGDAIVTHIDAAAEGADTWAPDFAGDDAFALVAETPVHEAVLEAPTAPHPAPAAAPAALRWRVAHYRRKTAAAGGKRPERVAHTDGANVTGANPAAASGAAQTTPSPRKEES